MKILVGILLWATGQGIFFPASAQQLPEIVLPKVELPKFKPDTFSIVNYGAKEGLTALNSLAISKTIDACSASGGGVVLIPEGLWITGPVELKSNTNLHLQKGALLQFSKNFDDYPLIKTTFEGLDAYRCKAPLYALDINNIAITGNGVIDGGGEAWRAVKKSKMTEPQWKALVASGGVLSEDKTFWYPSQKSLKGSLTDKAGVIAEGTELKDLEAIKDFLRPNMVSLTNCKNVLIENVTIQNSPAWCLHPLMCDQITLKNLRINNPWYGQNGDGVDLESCKNAVIENCSFDVGDDAICIKSGRDEQGRKRGIPTENVLIKNCIVYHGHGGFVVGSEMSGGAKNIIVSNCTFMGTDIGIRFKTTRGRGGVVENIYIEDIKMVNIVGEAILFDMFYGAKDPIALSQDDVVNPDLTSYPVTEATPVFRSIHIKDVICKGAARGLFIQGLPEMNVKDIYLENITIEAKEGMLCIEGQDIKIKNLTLHTPEKNPIKIDNSKRVTIDNFVFAPGADLLLKVGGYKSEDIKLINTKNAKEIKQIEFNKEVLKK